MLVKEFTHLLFVGGNSGEKEGGVLTGQFAVDTGEGLQFMFNRNLITGLKGTKQRSELGQTRSKQDWITDRRNAERIRNWKTEEKRRLESFTYILRDFDPSTRWRILLSTI